MSNKKIVAITISDVHIHNWKSHNEGMKRTESTMMMLNYIAKGAEEMGVPVLLPGDLFHGEIGAKLLTLVEERWPSYFNENLYAISGNHDQEEKSYPEAPTNSMVTYFGKKGRLMCLDFAGYMSIYKRPIMIHGIPYLTYNKGFSEEIKKIEVDPRHKNILMIHTDLYGATETDGREVDSVEGLTRDMKIFDRFDLVLCGHIHKPQEIIPGKVLMVGAPNQQRKSDANGKFGCWYIYEDMSYEFKEITFMPKFRFYDEGSIPENNTDYWIMNNRDGVEVVDEDELEFSARSSKTSLARAFLKATGEKRISYKRALIATLKEIENDKI